jgi:hypothetical protein
MGSNKKRLRVYLSGGMEYVPDQGADWRADLGAWIEKELGHAVFNPNIESQRYLRRILPEEEFRKLKFRDVMAYTSVLRHIVRIDLREIAYRSDYLVCLWNRGAEKGAGTKGEITLARFFNKPVFLLTRHRLENIPGWVLACVTQTFSSMSELKIFLKRRFKYRKVVTRGTKVKPG